MDLEPNVLAANEQLAHRRKRPPAVELDDRPPRSRRRLFNGQRWRGLVHREAAARSAQGPRGQREVQLESGRRWASTLKFRATSFVLAARHEWIAVVA